MDDIVLRSKEEVVKEPFLQRYRKWIAPVAIFGGFVADIFTLNQIDQILDQGILVAHLLISGFAIAMMFTRDSRFGKKIRIEEKAGILEALMLFSFGGLFSGFAIFYTRSGSIVSSWPFIVVMLLLMIGTEFYKKYYRRMILQITLYFVALFAYMIMFVPLVINKMGPWVFVLSGAISLGLAFLFGRLLRFLNKKKFQDHAHKMVIWVGMFFVLFNVAYFTNIIPPVPLSLKFTAVYHNVEKLYPGYEATYEKNPWWNIWRKRSRIFRKTGTEPAWVYASVFAPADFETEVVHVWEHFDTDKLDWVKKGQVPLTIQGGSKKGWAGFSKRSALEDGRWRVGVETPRGQVIGFIYFRVETVDAAPKLYTERP